MLWRGVTSPTRYRCGRSATFGGVFRKLTSRVAQRSFARDQAMSPSAPSSPRPGRVRAGWTKGGPLDFHWPNTVRCAPKATRERQSCRDAQSATSGLTDYTPAHTSPLDVVDPEPDLAIHEQRPPGYRGRHGQAIPAHLVIISQPVYPLPREAFAVRRIIRMPHRTVFRRRAGESFTLAHRDAPHRQATAQQPTILAPVRQCQNHIRCPARRHEHAVSRLCRYGSPKSNPSRRHRLDPPVSTSCGTTAHTGHTTPSRRKLALSPGSSFVSGFQRYLHIVRPLLAGQVPSAELQFYGNCNRTNILHVRTNA